MTVSALLRDVYDALRERTYFTRLELLEQSTNILKLRLYITSTLFVQIYRNDRLDTTNLVLVYNGQRLYARDELAGQWHRHPAEDPAQHDYTPEGQRAVAFDEFLNEIEFVLSRLNLP